MKFEFKQPTGFWEKYFLYMYVAVKNVRVALDERSKVSLTFGANIIPVSH